MVHSGQNMNLEDAQDGYFNKEKAQAQFAEAKKELEAQRCDIPDSFGLASGSGE